MAPMIQDDFNGVGSPLPKSKSTEKPTLYEHANQDDLQKKAKKYLANYGTKFENDIITGSRGLYVYSANGHKILDWTSGQMSCLIGHGHPEVVEAVRKHAESLDHLYSGMLSPPIIQLANKLTEQLPAGLDRAMFLSTGGEANECAMKL